MAGEPGRKTPNWRALARLKKRLLRDFRDVGVDHVEYVVAFSAPFEFWVWLGTATDAERDSLAKDPALTGRVRPIAERYGVATLLEGVTFESKETVDREYEGQWFYRLR